MTDNVPQSPRDKFVNIRKSVGIAIATLPLTASISVPKPTSAQSESTQRKIFQTKSGLQYSDYEEGVGESPRFGQLISFHYKMYYRPNRDASLEEIDSTYKSPGQTPFLHKHGNGRLIRGLDEGIHGMRAGGRRRIIVPQSVGYTQFGLGPLPYTPKARKRLGQVIDLVTNEEGQLIFDVTLLLVADDENDQGYYDDIPISQDEVRELVLKSMKADTEEAGLVDRIIQTTPTEIKGKKF